MRRGIVILTIVYFVAWPFVKVQAQENQGDNERTGVAEQERETEGRVISPPAPVTPQNSSGFVQPANTNTSADNSAVSTNQSEDREVNTNEPVIAPAVSIVDSTTQTAPLTKKPSSWPWYVTRALGISSFLLLFVMAATGMMQTTGLLYRIMSPAAAWSFHRTVGVFLIFSILLHLIGLLLDRFINLRVVDVLVPFMSPYKPLLVALGIGGFYLFIPVILTSLAWVDTKVRFWRTTHFLGFPMFLAIFLHGILIGTDRKLPWMQGMYWGTGIIIGILVFYRLWWKWRPRHALVS